jgi:organic radical activating enzyme
MAAQECLAIAKGCLIVVTGGEPFRQDLSELFLVLIKAGYYVQVETNGTLPAPISHLYNKVPSERKGVYIVCSPKTGTINQIILDNACALKYVVNAGAIGFDGLPVRALDHKCHPYLARPPENWALPIYLHPADIQDEVRNTENLQACIKSCLKHGYILQLQLHKIIGLA